MSSLRRLTFRRRQDGLLRVYRAGTDVTETVPAGVGNVNIQAIGGGGGGGKNLIYGGGGGGGAYVYKTIAVAPGNTFTYTVGVGGAGKTGGSGNGSNGTSSIVTGNVLGGSVNLVAGYGETTRGSGSTSNAGYGGIATGGDDNVPGANALNQIGGGGAGPRGGAGGIRYANDDGGEGPGTFPPAPPTEFGGGGFGQFGIGSNDLSGADGKHGVVIFDYIP